MGPYSHPLSSREQLAYLSSSPPSCSVSGKWWNSLEPTYRSSPSSICSAHLQAPRSYGNVDFESG